MGDEELEPLVSALEDQMTEIRERLAHVGDDAAAPRVLASGADRDVSEVRAELRGHRSALNALQETLTDTRREMRAGFEEMRGETQGGFAAAAVGFAAIADRLDRAIGEG